MKRIAFLLSLIFIFAGSLNSVSAQDKKSTILSIDNDAVTLEEFENIFRKNNRDSAITKASLDEYMELFINFKLKVKEAREMGLDTVSKFRNELLGYRAQLARPYLTDGEMLDDLVKEAYDHMTEEVKCAHILIKCDQGAAPADTLKAYNRIVTLREKILAGADFKTIARDNSEDPSAHENGGELGYFTAFQMVYPFEESAYATPVGKVSAPTRTRYGYHILFVEDRRPARGEIHVEHIMVKEKAEENGAANAEAKIREISQKIMAGESFEELAGKYSEDGSSAKKGGELPWFGTNKMVSEFEEAAFALMNDGDVSAPFKTSYGWHIVKRIGYKPVPAFDTMEKEIRSKVSKDVRAEKTRESFVNKLKVQYNFKFMDGSADLIASKADTNVFNGILKVKKKALKAVLFEINGIKHTNKEVVDYIAGRKGMRSALSPKDYVLNEAHNYAIDQLVKYEDSQLEGKYDAFRLLVNEYREGILLFELTDQKVWSKAVKDSVGLEKFYEENKSKFLWPDRVDAIIYTCANQNVATDLRKLLAAGVDKSEIAAQLNNGTQLNLQIEQGVYSREDKDILSRIDWKKGLSKEIKLNDQVVIVDIREVISSSPKRLNEAKGLVTSEYQNYLEEQWIKELRSKHKFTVNKEVLYSIH